MGVTAFYDCRIMTKPRPFADPPVSLPPRTYCYAPYRRSQFPHTWPRRLRAHRYPDRDNPGQMLTSTEGRKAIA
jgi:hypothetical protein